VRLMNQVFRSYIGKLVVVYFNDILICSKSKEQHLDHVTQTIMVLEKEKLYGNLKKCTFFKTEVIFLGYIMTIHGIKVDESKVEAIQSSPMLKSIYDTWSSMDLPHSMGSS